MRREGSEDDIWLKYVAPHYFQFPGLAVLAFTEYRRRFLSRKKGSKFGIYGISDEKNFATDFAGHWEEYKKDKEQASTDSEVCMYHCQEQFELGVC